MDSIIVSSQNKTIKQISALKNKKERDKYSLFVAEGERFVSEVPDEKVKYFVLSESCFKNSDFNFLKKAPYFIVKDDLYKKISDTVSPQGVLAVCEKLSYNIEAVLNKENPFFVLLENLRDPGNLGTIIRTADAAGASAVFLSNGSVDMYNNKVLRSTMGSIFHLPIIQNVDFNKLIGILKQKNIKVLAAHLEGAVYPYDVNLKEPCSVLIGNEANGLTRKVTDLADLAVKIPMPGSAESMNASVACSILVYEIVRQRLF